jgi:hypothetical protein
MGNIKSTNLIESTRQAAKYVLIQLWVIALALPALGAALPSGKIV